MITDTVAVKTYFAKLGLEPEIADIYLALYAYGPQTISELARNSKVERTRIYRLMEALRESNLVEVEVHYKRNIFKAAPISNLQILITKKEQELHSLEAELGILQQALGQQALESPLTKVQFYQGLEGTKQMFWNATKAHTEVISILYENMQGKTKSAFFERWVRRCNERNMRFRGIINDHFIETQQDWYSHHSNERLKNWESRYLPNNIFLITHSMTCYDNVVSYYNWKQGEVFGIEIYNEEIANAQRAFFEMLWIQTTPVNDLIGPKKSVRLHQT